MRSTTNKLLEQDLDLRRFELFSTLTEFEFNRLDYDKTCEVYKKGTVIYKEGSRLNGFFCITKGIVKILKTGIEGKEQIIRFAKSGEIIGYRSLLSEELACSTAKVIDEAVLFHIPYHTLLSLIQTNWQFGFHLLQISSRELRESNNYIVGLAQKSVRERLAEVLLLLKESFELDNQNILQISLKRLELADFVGTAPESLIRLLSEFKHDKLIEVQGKKIRLLDINRLRQVANV
jgi:CRP-like cAMP-binding protein